MLAADGRLPVPFRLPSKCDTAQQMRYVFFDLGNVLVHFDPNLACRNVAQLVGREESEVFAAMYGTGIETRYERGDLNSSQFAAALRVELASEFATGDLLREMSAMFTPNAAMETVIGTLRQRGIPLGILSNTCPAHWDWVMAQAWPVTTGWYRDAVLSFEVGHMKPEPEIYQRAAEVAGVAPSEIFFTDDRLENVEAAREAGWMAEVFHDVEMLRRQLNA